MIPASLRTCRLVLGVLICTSGCPARVLAQDEEERALEAVRAEIAALESRLSRQNAERDAGYRSLKSVEVEVASAAKELADIQTQLDEQRARGQALAQEVRAAGQRLDRERAQLAEQVRMTYMTGRQEMLRLLLNQESPARLGRMVVYYDYLNRARTERVEAVSAELRAVAELTAAAERVARELGALQEARSRELERLSRSRDGRRTVLAKLEEDIASSGDEIGRLRQEEQRLTQLLAELETLLSAFPMDSQAAFPRIKGELGWPVPGALVRDYGQARASGQLKWNGVVVEAAGGTPVRAVYHGRVVYADWLPGMGLLVIVDHGDGYMSLYGHNEAILKESGDWVAPGEVIAQVGDSGGQAQTALYFEIRHHGEPVDPHPWMGQRLPR